MSEERAHWRKQAPPIAAMPSTSLHFINTTRTVNGSQRDVWRLRRFHHDVLWQHNYALDLTWHGSPNHISCGSECSIPTAAAAAELRGGAARMGVLGWVNSEPGAKQRERNGNWRPGAEGAEQRCRRSAHGLSLCISVRLWALASGAGAEAPRGRGGKKRSKTGECSVLKPALPLHIPGGPF